MPSASIFASGTWALPSGVSTVTIYVIGGGGGGGRGNLSGGGAGGGGGGSAAQVYGGSPGDVLTITIGAAGVGTGASGTPAGSAGGDTFVQNPSGTDICHATGGALGLNKSAGALGGVGTIGLQGNLYTGGSGGAGVAGGNGGSGGSAADASVTANGNNGSTGAGVIGGASPGGNAGAGGTSGDTATSAPNGIDGARYGGGGGGGDENGGGSAGGNGYQGMVYITWNAPRMVPRNPLVFRPRQTLVWLAPIAPTTTPVVPRPLIASAGSSIDAILAGLPETPPSVIFRAPVRTVPYPRPLIATPEAPPDVGVAFLLRTTAKSATVIPPPRAFIVVPEQRQEEGQALVLHAPQPVHLPVWPTRVITAFHNEEWPPVFQAAFRAPLVHVVTTFDHCLAAFNVTLTVPGAGSIGLTVPGAASIELTVPVASDPSICNG